MSTTESTYAEIYACWKASKSVQETVAETGRDPEFIAYLFRKYQAKADGTYQMERD